MDEFTPISAGEILPILQGCRNAAMDLSLPKTNQVYQKKWLLEMAEPLVEATKNARIDSLKILVNQFQIPLGVYLNVQRQRATADWGGTRKMDRDEVISHLRNAWAQIVAVGEVLRLDDETSFNAFAAAFQVVAAETITIVAQRIGLGQDINLIFNNP